MKFEDIDFKKKYYYNHLTSEEEKRLYRLMVASILNNRLKFIYRGLYCKDYEIPKKYKNLTVLDNPEAPAEGNIFEAYFALFYDFPEFYYIETPRLNYKFDMEFPFVFYAEPLNGKYKYKKSDIKKYNEMLDELYHRFDSVPTGFELEVAVNDYLVKEYDYDNSTEGEGKTIESEEKFTVLGPLKRKLGVCAAYTKLAQYIFNRRGMESVIILTTGDFTPDECHCWLAVKLEGKYYHLDITFNEGDTEMVGTIQYSNFNITDKELLALGTHHERENYPDIVCTSKKHNYFYHKGLYFKTPEEVEAGYEKYVKEHEGTRGTHYFRFRASRRLTKKETGRAIYRAWKRIGPCENIFLIKHGCYYTVELKCEENDTSKA